MINTEKYPVMEETDAHASSSLGRSEAFSGDHTAMSVSVMSFLNRDDGGACPGCFDDELVIAAISTQYTPSVAKNRNTGAKAVYDNRFFVVASRDCRGLFAPGAVLHIGKHSLTPSDMSDETRQISVRVGRYRNKALADTHLFRRFGLCLLLFPLPSGLKATVATDDGGTGAGGEHFDAHERQLLAGLIPDGSGLNMSLTPAESYLRLGKTLRRIASICGCGVCFVGVIPTRHSYSTPDFALMGAVFTALALTFRRVALKRGFNFSVDNVSGAEVYTFHALLFHDEIRGINPPAENDENIADGIPSSSDMVDIFCNTISSACVRSGCYFLARVRTFDSERDSEGRIRAVKRLIVRFCPAPRNTPGQMRSDEWNRLVSIDNDDITLDLSGIY